ncbi:MAG: Major Facilitator Superfamily protein [Syntrophus sp. PtaU1.Bin005]|nr:MAG: Major Facilitator Superfamily protein [Syntrophus sp. PtaB.Bin138]OPY80719.1 MAG: Major Facilitator Superfamily protein [Syntrophus sp. PtaU1.Bin005]
MYTYLMVLVICASAGLQGWMALFTNFAKEVVGVNGFQIGVAQAVREIPGFLTFMVMYVLLIMKEHRLSAWSVVLLGIGIGATGYFPTFPGMLMVTVIMSVGFHFFETTNKSLTVQYFDRRDAPVVFARLRGYGALANIAVGTIVWGLSFLLPYHLNFLLLGIFISSAGIYMLSKNPVQEHGLQRQNKLVLRRKYWLYYVLNFLSGARRQIFIVFAVFLLVEKYRLSVSTIAGIYVLNYTLTYLTNRYISRAINVYGERVVLSLESASLFILFLGYALIENAWVAVVLYILDSIFFNFAIGLNTYLQKTADPGDLAQSTAIGFTINHISAVVIPLLGGSLWLLNWKLPFIIGAGLTLVSLYFTQKIKMPLH